MPTDIVPQIEKLLFQHETLVIPGFGAFHAQRKSAQADAVGGTLNPPARTLSFDEERTVDDGVLSAEIAGTYQVSQERAQEMIREFVADMQTLLDKREIVSLPGIGRLYRNYVQKIQFLPDSTNFSMDAYGLPPLQFSPIAESRETTEQAAAPEVAGPVAPPAQPYYPTEPAPDPSRWLPLAGIAFLLVLAIAGWIMMRPGRPAATSADSPTETGTEQPVDNGSDAITVEPAPAEPEPEPAPEPEAQDVETASLPVPGGTIQSAIEKEKVNEPPVSSGRECIVIIGVFKDADNIAQLKKKLTDNDFTLYQAAAKNGEQIGVRFRYQEVADIQRNLNTLEKITGVRDLWIKKK